MCGPSQVAKCAQYHNISIHPTKSAPLKGVDQVYKDRFSAPSRDVRYDKFLLILNFIGINILWWILKLLVFLNLKWQIHEQELDRLSKVWTIVLAVLGRRIICNLKTFNLYVNKLLQSNPQLKMFDQKLFSLICWTIKSVSRTLSMSCS